MKPVELTAELLRTLPLPQPEPGSKDKRGSVLIIAGSAEVPGAARLAGEAALRAGAGKLQIATAHSVAPHLAMVVPEALVMGFPEMLDGGIEAAAAMARLQAKTEKVDAVSIGAGMTPGEDTTALTAALCGSGGSSFVLDAAALHDLSDHADAVRKCEGRVVLTPHAGEMCQLLGTSREEIEADPLEAALTASRLLRAVVVMKGAETHIVDPEGGSWLFRGGGVGLATSGSGDVLAGLVTGLLARGADPVRAALWGVYLHGEAGRILGEREGPLGYLARSLAAEVPRIMREFVEA